MRNQLKKILFAPEALAVAFALLVVMSICITLVSGLEASTSGETVSTDAPERSTAVEVKTLPAPESDPTPEQPPETVESTTESTETATDTAAPETTGAPRLQLDPREVELIARTIWGEAGGVKSETERAAVAWCILNRVDAWGQSIEYVVTKPYQFLGYRPNGECPQQHYDLAADVLARWYAEKDGKTNAGRVLPKEYLYFIGDLVAHNWYSIEWQSGIYWDWSLPSPYDN